MGSRGSTASSSSAPAEPIRAIFLDDGGVLNDNQARAPQWDRLVAEFLTARFGGDRERWQAVHRQAFNRWLEAYLNRAPALRGAALRALLDELDREWLRDHFRLVGLQPPDEESALRLARELLPWAARRIQAAIPGAADAVRALHDAGFRLYLASAGDAVTLAGYLEGMGIADCILRPYGVDLVGVPKAGPDFYRAIFVDAGVDAAGALIVDDRVEALRWAQEAGAGRALLVGGDLSSISDLPRMLGIQ